MKKSLLLFVLLFALTLPDPGLSQAPLKVGALIPFGGRWEDSGRECAKGAVDAARWINQRGGIYGRKLEISLIEDTHQPAEFVAAFRKLNEADRVLVLYLYSPETGLALLPYIHYHRIPTFIGSFTSHLADPAKYPYIFSITPTSLDLSKIAMTFISQKSESKTRRPKVVFVGTPDHHGKHFLQEAKAYARMLGLDLAPDLWISDFSSGDRISSSLGPLKSSHPEIAYVSLSPKEASSLLLGARDMGLKNRWMCSMRTFDETLSAFDGVMGVQPIAPFGEDLPGMAEIQEAHRRWHPYDSHTVSYVEGWATTQVIAHALGRSFPESMVSRDRVKSVLEDFKDYVLGGLVPPLTITPKDHRPSVESRIFIVKEGKLIRRTAFISTGR